MNVVCRVLTGMLVALLLVAGVGSAPATARVAKLPRTVLQPLQVVVVTTLCTNQGADVTIVISGAPGAKGQLSIGGQAQDFSVPPGGQAEVRFGSVYNGVYPWTLTSSTGAVSGSGEVDTTGCTIITPVDPRKLKTVRP